VEQSIKALIEKARRLVAQNMYPEAYDVYQQLCIMQTATVGELSDAEVWCMWGVLDAELGQLVPAINKWRQALAINPQHALSHFRIASTLLQLGQMEDALRHCNYAVQSAPEFAEAWLCLADIQGQRGMHADSENSALQVVALLPECTDAFLLLANAQLAQRKFLAAIQSFKKALAAGPALVETVHRLAVACHEAGDLDGAAGYFERTLQLEPDHVSAYEELASVYRAKGRLDAAESINHDAVRRFPGRASAHHGLGVTLYARDRLQEAALAFTEASLLDRTSVAPVRNLATLSWKMGNADEALKYCLTLMELEPGEIHHRHNFIQALHATSPKRANRNLLRQIQKCFEMPGLDLHELVKPVTQILKNSGEFTELMELGRSGLDAELENAISGLRFDGVLQMGLFHSLLINTVVADPDFEVLLAALRRAFLHQAMSCDELSAVSERRIGLAVALACQCFNNEYVYRQLPDEAPLIERLKEQLASRFDPRGERCPDFGLRHAVLCMYMPLHQQEWLVNSLEVGDFELPDSFHDIEKRQWRDRVSEAAIMEEIESITETSDPTSVAVRGQYEESPYPRWLSVGIHTPRHYADVIHEKFEHYDADPDRSKPAHVLNAGCGTGRHAIMSATRYSNADVLAVDLSKSSLAYARRSAQELGIGNIDFKQGDILKLGKLARQFHIIECSGVLHHIEQTEVALKILTDLLYPGGLIMLGLYSRIARGNVRMCAEYIASRGYKKVVSDILRARQEIFALDDARPEKRVLQSPDFYALSACRDLLFHEHEHSYELPEIRGMLQRCGLEFLGFEHHEMQVSNDYRQRHPDDPGMTNLDYWHAYENDHPRTFSRMYVMWCLKT